MWFCDLTEARDLNGIASIVATSLGIQLGHGDPVEQLGHAIAGRGQCLLILDNFEPVVAYARRTVGRWRAGHLARFWSRAASGSTRTMNESRWWSLCPSRAESSCSPPGARPVSRSELAGAEAEAVGEIVRLVDGMPLAIELAARACA